MSNLTVFELVNKHRTKIMGFAALWIIIFHVWQRLFVSTPLLFEVEYLLKSIGFYGVDMFFFLSGAGLVYSINKNSLGKYYINRFKRIIIPFLISGFVIKIQRGWDFKTLLLNFFGYSFFKGYVLNFLWFFMAIIVVYITFPLYYWVFNKIKHKNVFFVFEVIVWFVVSYLLKDIVYQDLYYFTNRIPVILAGVLFGYYGYNSKKIYMKDIIYITIGMFLVGLYMSYLQVFKDVKFFLPASRFAFSAFLTSIPLIVILAAIFDWLNSKCNFSSLYFLGKLSLELYTMQEIRNEFPTLDYNGNVPKLVYNVLIILFIVVFALLIRILEEIVFSLIEKREISIENVFK